MPSATCGTNLMPAVACFLSLQLCKASPHIKKILCNTCHLGNEVMGHYEQLGGHAYIHVLVLS